MRCWNVALYREIVEEHFFATKAEAIAFCRQSKLDGFPVTEMSLSHDYPATNAGLAEALSHLIERTCYNEG